ncbi:MAG: hypothetical protein V1754_09520 [Pseudomonadota bacterium]
MANRQEDSVVSSLAALRQIEDKRATSEKEGEKQRAEEIRRVAEQARLEAQRVEEQRRRSEAERLRVEEETRLRKEQEERVQKAEEERRAQIRAEIETHKERIANEVEHKIAARKLPWTPIIAGICVLAVAVIAVGYYSYIKSVDAEKAAAVLEEQKEKVAALQEDVANTKIRFAKEQADLQKEKQELAKQLLTAKTDAEREEIRKREERRKALEDQLERRREEKQNELRDRRRRLGGATKSSDDPIGKIDL